MANSPVIATRIPAEVRDALARAAEADQRSVSWLLAKIAAEWCRRQGLLPKQPSKARKAAADA